MSVASNPPCTAIPDLEYDAILLDLGLKVEAVEHFMASYDDLDQFEDLLVAHRGNKDVFASKLKDLIEPKKFTQSNVNKLMIVFDWFHYYSDHEKFSWNLLTCAKYATFKRNGCCHS